MSGRYLHYLPIFIILGVLFYSSGPVDAQSVDQLKSQITSKNQEIAQLEREIAEFQKKLNATKGQSATLRAELNRLETTKRKLETDVALTQKKIDATSLTIEKLGGDILTSSQKIAQSEIAIAEALRQLHRSDQHNLTLVFLEYDSLSDFLGDVSNIETLRQNLADYLSELRQTKASFEEQKILSEQERRELASLQIKLADQRKIVSQNQTQKNTLLAQTQNEEKSYQQLLADRIAKKNAVEAEIRRAEEALNLIVNPGALPATGRGVIKWPLDNVRITQYFGNTPFATANPQIYSGKGHNGIDFAAAVGTPIKAVLDGVVQGVGDTDTACKGASYGKWVMIKHPNGLSSVYAHLSLSKVAEGQTVKTGDVIAYSGATGYVTGPHLHFTLLASDGSQVGTLQSAVPGCGVYRLPLATPQAVLNPLSYL
jgi:murein DD-endopeptidase MepM/ murein hydrolase activator NlpD